MKLLSFRRPKITYSSSYVDYRPETNAVLLLNMGHTPKGKMHTGGIGKG
jgi:hypothetical protein